MSAILERSKTFAQKPAVKRTALGGGTAAIMLSIYQIFLTKAEFEDFKWERRKEASQHWQQIQDAHSEIEKLKAQVESLRIAGRERVIAFR